MKDLLKPRRWTSVPHRPRPEHDREHPVHVTWRMVRRLPNMRSPWIAGVVGRAIRASSRSNERRKTGFRVIHFSIQSNHLHLIVEGKDRTVLAGGLRGLAIWIARRINEAYKEHQQVFAQRYHARALTTSRQVRTAIVYVLMNHKHHEPSDNLVDENSSGRWFDGWVAALPRPETPSPVSLPETWLAKTGWLSYGRIRFEEAPAS